MSHFPHVPVRIAALAVALAVVPTLAQARHHWRAPPSDVVRPLETLTPPPQMFYPQPHSSAYGDANRQVHPRSQVPLGQAGPGVTPYEMLPNKP
jgi:hypothetical protein